MGEELSKNIIASSQMQSYFINLHNKLEDCYRIAEEARKKGFDPDFKVEISKALDLAARVEQLVGPEGIASRIREAIRKLNDRELVSIEIAKEIVNRYRYSNREEAIEQAIRTGLAILTEGVLVAPIEGIAGVKIGKNKDGSDYVDLYFAGPIRSAGGTGQAMSVLIADIVRRELGIGRYIPTQGEIERYKEEIPLYKRVQHLQYLPSPDEIEKIVKNCPVCINGEATEDEEVTGYRDLPRVETNRLRGGACLVIAEGLCLKAPKVLKHVKKLKLEGWDFLEIFVSKEKKDEIKKTEEIPEIVPSSKYMGEVIAGRPVFSHPSRKGGFRLRYGRARTCGLAATAINPASMFLTDEFIAVGTQIKTERPGKATVGTPCDTIEGPIILTKNGDLVQVDNINQIKKSDVKEIVDLGEILIPYGEFLENNSLLPDSSYVYEWWIQELQREIGTLPDKYDFSSINKADEGTFKKVKEDFGREIDLRYPSAEDAFKLSEKYRIPLHPYYNLFWHDIGVKDLIKLSNYIKENGKLENNNLILPNDKEIKNILIDLGCLHKQEKEKIVIDRYSYPLIRCCGLERRENEILESERFSFLSDIDENENILSVISKLAGVTVRARSPSRIGARMGRPEKASERKMRPPPHVLFPVGNYGGNQRLINEAANAGTIEIEAGTRFCPKCNSKTYKILCNCGTHTIVTNGKIELHKVNLAEEIKLAQRRLNERNLPETIKGVIGTISKHKTPEPLEKGILRAKHDVHVFKDGTIRFDMTDVPLTHFKPKEIGVSVDKLRELGYTRDYLGNELISEHQICELKPQDVIISKACAEYFVKVSRFIDDLLAKFYKLERFYNIKDIDDLLGHLAIGLAPHTSAAVLCRIIGFTDAQVCFAHPFYHAAKRRNCDGDEDALMLLLDALINFSRSYIPDKRGGQMDIPLILTTHIDPLEIDKEAHNIDVLFRYPLKFYEATLRHANPREIEEEMELISDRLGTELQYEKFGFTHDTNSISDGPKMSNYKTLRTMTDKMTAQLNLAALIRAVDEADVAYKVIEKHFLPDIIGNMRAFSQQSVRCPTCNILYRRPPLQGVCTECGGKLTLTVHEKSVKKYLEIAKDTARRYNIPPYAQQRILLIEKAIDSLFTSDKVRNTRLTDFL